MISAADTRIKKAEHKLLLGVGTVQEKIGHILKETASVKNDSVTLVTSVRSVQDGITSLHLYSATELGRVRKDASLSFKRTEDRLCNMDAAITRFDRHQRLEMSRLSEGVRQLVQSLPAMQPQYDQDILRLIVKEDIHPDALIMPLQLMKSDLERYSSEAHMTSCNDQPPQELIVYILLQLEIATQATYQIRGAEGACYLQVPTAPNARNGQTIPPQKI